MNFIRTIFSVATTLRGFPALAERPLWRGMLYYIFMVAICAFCLALFQYPHTARIIKAGMVLVNEEFGQVTPSDEGGFQVELRREESRALLLPGNIAAGYVAADNLLPALPKDAAGGIIFSREHIVIWLGGSNGIIVEMPASTTGSAGSNMRYSDSNLAEIFAKEPQKVDVDGENTAEMLLMMTTQPAYIKTVLFMANMMDMLIKSLPMMLIFVAIFGGFGALRNSGLIKIKELIAINIYASLPVIAVGALCRGLDLIWLDFGMVFMLGSSAYTVVAVNYVVLSRQAGLNKSQGEQ